MTSLQPITGPVADQSTIQVLETLPVGVVVIDNMGFISLVNAETERLFGYNRAEIIGRPIETLLPERYRVAHAGLRSDYAKSPVPKSMGVGRDLFGRHKDGREFPVEIGLNPLVTLGGRAIVASVVDISERKRFERNFNSIINAAPYGMMMIDQRGQIVMVNDQLLKTFGYERAELMGQSVEILIPDRWRDGHAHHRMGFFSSPSQRLMGAGRDLTGLHRDGTEISVEIGLSPVESGAGTVALAAVVDISQRKRSEQNLRQALAGMEEFTYVASHDLKSPLRGIMDLVTWIAEDIHDHASEQVTKNLDRVMLRIQRMDKMIDDLLAFARAGQTSTEMSDIDIKSMIEGILELQPRPEKFKIDVALDVQDMKAARTPLETALRNLISNAVKHHDREDGQVKVEVIEDDGYCRFSVSDDGPGIPVSAHERIFKLFQTLTVGERNGSGIGLTLTKRLVENYGGKITVQSEDGSRGTIFRFWWPRFPRRGFDG